MMRFFSFLAMLCLALQVANSQVVSTEPIFPTQDGDVVVTFDATKGNGALAGFTGDVYAHTGVITSTSTTPSDWKFVVADWATDDPRIKMNRVGTDLYQLSYNIQDFYGFPESTEALQLAFVFRNLNGDIVGRDTDGSDIFVDLNSNAALITTFFSPESENLVVSPGETIEVNAGSSVQADLTLTDNGQVIESTTGTSIVTTITAMGEGDHEVVFTASTGSESQSVSFNYFVLDASTNVADPPAGTLNGINRLSESSIILQLNAPLKESVFVLGSFNDWSISGDYLMNKSTDGNKFWLQIDNLDPNEVYTYQYLIDGSITIADPYSELILDPNSDSFIPASTYPDIPEYPTGETTGFVTVLETAPASFDWQTNDFEAPKKTDLVVYELLLRDFFEARNFQTLKDTLDYLERLGINAIELMPVSEFENNDSWGYNPSFHMALDKFYGSREAFKELVDEAHARGMAVILDVVYNHAFGQSPLVTMYWDPANNRPAANSPYHNPIPKHPFNVGFDFNHESEHTKEFVKQTLEFWIEEYRVDGFRFDLSKGFTQVDNLNDVGAWGRYDASRIAILTDYANHVWSIDPDSYIIMEHFAENQEEKEMADLGMMFWNNQNFQYAEASMGYPNNLNGADYQDRGWAFPHLITYMESHDEERMNYKNQQFGNSSGNYDTRDFQTGLRRVELASTFFYTIPGPKMLWQFGELGYDFSINTCVNGTVTDNCRLDRKPIRWDYLDDPDRLRLYTITSSLIYFKTQFPVTETTDYALNISNNTTKSIHLNHEDFNTTVIGNFGVSPNTIDPQFQNEGMWYEYFTGDSLMVTNTNSSIFLEAGEYRLYTDKKLDLPERFLTDVDDVIVDETPVVIAPNPTSERSTLFFELQDQAPIRVSLHSMDGRVISLLWNEQLPAGMHQLDLPAQSNPGIYFIQLVAGEQRVLKKWVVID